MRAMDFRRWRTSSGLSQEQAAHALGVAKSTVQRWERYGVPELQEARRKAILQPASPNGSTIP